MKNLLEDVRTRAGLTQQMLAARAGTSRSTLSAYEHGRKSPTLDTVTRLLGVSGFSIVAMPVISFTEVATSRARQVSVPNRLWRLPLNEAFAEVELPIQLNWSEPGRKFLLTDRKQRARCYEIVLREGDAHHILKFIDGALLIELWDELVLPKSIRQAWQEVIDKEIEQSS